MHSQSHLWDLISLWHQQHECGAAISVEDLCRDCPELLPELQRHLVACRQMSQFLSQHGATIDDLANHNVDASAQTRVYKQKHEGDQAEAAALAIPGYDILSVLGRGGMGVVYQARQQGLNRIVALKMILSGVHAGEQERARFLAEAEAIARLQHPNVVQVFEVGQHEGNPYLSLEFVAGGTLAARIRGEPQQPRAAAELVEVLAQAVQAAHERGIVHRDLKPGNVLLTATGTPKVTDFGLAKKDDGDLTVSGAIVGTPSYMAPEQAKGETHTVGPAADVYALGAILYELLTGRPPFKAASGWDTMQMVIGTEPLAPTRLQPAIPRDLETICLKCLLKEPLRRYAAAAALAADCRAFLDGRPIAARRVGVVERGWRWAKRRPAAASLLVVSLLATLLLLGLGFWFSARLGTLRADRITVEERATTQRYHALRHRIQERSARREPGWTWANLNDLAEAAKLPDAADDVRNLRNEAALCLASQDVKLAAVVCKNQVGRSLAWHPDGRRLAVGLRGVMLKGLSAQVRLLSPERAEQEQTLHGSAWPVLNEGKFGPDNVLCLAFSPDGRWLVAGMRSGLLNRWDLTQPNSQAVSWRGHDGNVEALAFSRAGASLYSLEPGAVKRWETSSWQEKGVARSGEFAATLAVHPTEGWLTCGRTPIHCLHEESLRPLRPPLPQGASCLRWFPDGRSLVFSGARKLQLLDVHQLALPHPFLVPGTQHSEEGEISDLAVSPDGALILAACAQTGHVKVWDVLSGHLVADLAIGGDSCSVAFAPDGRSFAVCGDHETLIYSVRAFQEHSLTALQGEMLHSFALQPDGRSLACFHTGVREGNGEVLFWPLDAPARQPSRRQWIGGNLPVLDTHPMALSSRADWLGIFLPRDKHLLFLSTRGTHPSRAFRVDSDPSTLSFAGDGRLWADLGNGVCAWDMSSDEPVASWKNVLGRELTGRAGINAVAVGVRWVVAAGKDGSVRLLPAGSGTLELEARRTVAADPLRSAAVDEKQACAAVGSERGNLILLGVPSLDVLAQQKAHADRLDQLAFTAHGLLASGSRDGTVKLWRWDGRELSELWSWRGGRPVRGLAFRADGVTLAVLLQGERGVRLWHLERLWDRLRQLGVDTGLGTVTPLPLPPPSVPKQIQPDQEKPQGPYGATLELFADPELSQCVAVRRPWNIDWNLNHERQGVAPPQGLRFNSWLKVPKQGVYFLGVHSAGPCRVYLNNRLCLDGWSARGSEFHHRIESYLPGKPQQLRVEYLPLAPKPFIRLFWSQVKGFGEQTIQPNDLFPGRVLAENVKHSFIAPAPVRKLVGHESRVNGVAVSPDGTKALSGSADGTVRLWDIETGTEVLKLTDGPAVAGAVAFLPDGRRALSAHEDGQVRQWNLGSGKLLRRFLGHTAPVECLALAPDGKRLATGGCKDDCSVRVWDVESGRELHCFRGHPFNIYGLCWLPDSQRVVSSAWDGTLRVWDVTQGKAVAVLDHVGGRGQEVVAVQGGRCVASPSREDGKIGLFDLEQRRLRHVFQVNEPYLGSIACSPDGRLLAVGGVAAVHLRDPNDGSSRGIIRCDTARVRGLAFSPDGRLLLISGVGKANTEVQLWKVSPGAPNTQR